MSTQANTPKLGQHPCQTHTHTPGGGCLREVACWFGPVGSAASGARHMLGNRWRARGESPMRQPRRSYAVDCGMLNHGIVVMCDAVVMHNVLFVKELENGDDLSRVEL